MIGSKQTIGIEIVTPATHLPHLPLREPEPGLIVVIVDALRSGRPAGFALTLDSSLLAIDVDSS